MLISKKSKIFIAGHNGMVGSAIKRALHQKGYNNLLYASRNDLNLLNFEEVKNTDDFLFNNPEMNNILDDLQLTLKSLNYTKRQINSILPKIINETKTIDLINKKGKNASFENLLKLAMNYLDDSY